MRMMRAGGVAAALMAAVFAGHAAADVLLNPVAWVSAPSRTDVDAAVPAQVSERGPGYADLQCQVLPNGSLSHCEDAWSSDISFDRAALSLAPKFRAAVPTDLGPKIETVWVEIRFDFADSGRPGAPFELNDPQYLQAASRAPAATLLPRAAIDAGAKRALALVDCTGTDTGRLADCAVVKEVPAGVGVGAVALDALSKRRLNLWQGAEPVAGARVRIPLYIDAPTADDDPRFTAEVRAASAGPYYPQEAERKRIGGSATIECARQASGSLTDCIAISETPPNWDFAAAAMKMAQAGAITVSPDGEGAGPGVVRLRVPFRP